MKSLAASWRVRICDEWKRAFTGGVNFSFNECQFFTYYKVEIYCGKGQGGRERGRIRAGCGREAGRDGAGAGCGSHANAGGREERGT